MKMNKKGFTLMELLATVVILGIISTIGIVSVNKVLDKSHKEYEVKQAKMVTTAAQSYFTDNKSLLPQEVLKTEFVKLQELINNNYIDEVVDYKKEKYDYDKSITTVRKMAANRYVYYSKLIRKDGSKAVDENPENINSSSKTPIYFNYDLSESNRKEAIDGVYYVNNKILIDVKSDDIKEIAAYRYKLYKVVETVIPYKETEKKTKLYKKSEYISVNGSEYDDQKIIDKIILNKKNINDGKYEVEILTYDYNGNQSGNAISKLIVIDGTNPKCTIELDGTRGNKVEGLTDIYWYKQSDLKATIKVKDENKYQYATVIGQKLPGNYKSLPLDSDIEYIFDENIKGENFNVQVIDKAGNTGVCSKSVYYDKTAPKCSWKRKVDGYETSNYAYTNHLVTMELYCGLTNDSNDSGCTDKLYWSKEYTPKQALNVDKAAHAEIYDIAGNKEVCYPTVNHDSVPPYIDRYESKIYSSSENYNSIYAKMKLYITDYDASDIKYDVTVGYQSEKNYDQLPYGPDTPSVNETFDVNVGGGYDGGTREVYVTAMDRLGNKSVEKFDYKVYSACSSPPSTASSYCLGDWSSCTDECNRGLRYSTKVYNWVDTNANMTCNSFVTNGCNEECGGITYTIEDNWIEGECSKECGGKRKNTRIINYYGSDGHFCYSGVEEVEESCNDGCSITKCEPWPDKCVSSFDGYKKSRKCTTTNSDGTKTTTIKTKNCKHTHVWKARGNTIRSDTSWTCSHNHTRTIYFNVYCSLCGKKSEYPNPDGPTRACTVSPYTEEDGWTIFDDSDREKE